MRSCSWKLFGLIMILFGSLAVLSAHNAAFAQSKSVTNVFRFNTDGSYLGIQMEDVTADNMASYKLNSERGVIVKSVEKPSPAEAAGLQEKDVILEYAGMPVFSSTQFARLVSETPVGRKVELGISREGKRMTVSAKIGKREGDLGWNGGPGGEFGRQFEFRAPGPRHFEFHGPEGDWGTLVMPPGAGVRGFGEKPRLGVTLQPLTEQLAEFLGVPGKKGAMVTSVIEGSPAAGKLKAGDVIIKADGKSIEGPEDLIPLIDAKESNAKVTLTVIRDKKDIPVTIELAASDSGRARGGFRL